VNEINENEKNKMPNTNTIAKVFDTVLSIRGMNDNVKNSTPHSRKKCCALKQSNWAWPLCKSRNEESNIL